jgi:hypothetical protein
MAWSTPLTAVSSTSLTAAQWNASVRDNLLETAPAKATTAGSLIVASGVNTIAQRTPASALVSTSQSTTNTSYVDLTTAGPAVTVTTGTSALVAIYGGMQNSAATANVWMSFAVSGATTLAASDNTALGYDSPTAASTVYHGAIHLVGGLTAGSNTFTAKYRVSAGTGTFNQRRLLVVPL